MSEYVTDTHALIWYLDEELDSNLGVGARKAFREAEEGKSTIYVPSIVCVEMDIKGEEPWKPRHVSPRLLIKVFANIRTRQECYKIAPLDEAVIFHLSFIPIKLVPDPRDRIIAATAVALDLPLITKDPKIIECSKVCRKVKIIWDILEEAVTAEESDEWNKERIYE